MKTIDRYRQYGEFLENTFKLKTAPLAVKMLSSEDEIPSQAIRPKRDRNYHLSQCQAFALSRREQETVAMLKKDNWCFAPLIAYGLVDRPDDPRYKQFTGFPSFERDRYIGIVSAPLKSTEFEPDALIIYSDTAQLRDMLTPLHFKGMEAMIDYHFFPPACSYLIVPVMTQNRYMIALPDHGEHMRALPGENEIILSVPKSEIEGFISGLEEVETGQLGYGRPTYQIHADFPQPPMYQELFAQWGLTEND